MTIAKRFAAYIHDTTYADIPRDIHRFAKLCLLDWIGVTLGGSKEPVGDILLDMITEGLGTTYHIRNIAFKPYASALATHSTIQAIEAMRQEENFDATDVEALQIEFGPLPFSVVNRKTPQKILEGKFSVQHCAAIAIVKGRVGKEMFTEKELNDPQIVAFRERVNVVLNETLPLFETIVTLRTKQGATYRQFIKESKGSPGFPLSFTEMKAKFMDLADSVIPAQNAVKIVETIGSLQDLADMNELVALCSPTPK